MEKMTVVELGSVLGPLGESVSVIDGDLKKLYCNPAYGTLVGLSKREAMGRHCYDVLPGKACHTEVSDVCQVPEKSVVFPRDKRGG